MRQEKVGPWVDRSAEYIQTHASSGLVVNPCAVAVTPKGNSRAACYPEKKLSLYQQTITTQRLNKQSPPHEIINKKPTVRRGLAKRHAALFENVTDILHSINFKTPLTLCIRLNANKAVGCGVSVVFRKSINAEWKQLLMSCPAFFRPIFPR